MSYMHRVKKRRPLIDKVSKFLGGFPDLMYDGVKIICTVCDQSLMCWDKRDCKRHVNSAQHMTKKTGGKSQAQFRAEFIGMVMACNLSFRILDNETFRSFWNKYSPEWKLPSRRTVLSEIPSVREAIEKKITAELQNKKLWLCVDETTDCKKNSVVNVMVRTMEPLKPSCSLLLASKRLEQCTGEAVARVVLDTLEKFQLSPNQLLMFMTTDGARAILSVGRLLKKECGNFLHVTCKLYALYQVEEQIRRCYPNVNDFISHTETVFVKYSKRFRELHKPCPDIPEPPRIVTRWGTWLKAVSYYVQHFQKVKDVILQFDPKEATAIRESQAKFQDVQIEEDLQTIHRNYNGLLEAIEKLEDPSLSLVESLQTVDAVHTRLHALSDTQSDSVLAKFDSVLQKDSGFTTLRQICNDSACTDPLCKYKDHFSYANITSIDVERSFSSYKHIYSARRTCLAETTVETYLMLQTFNRFHPVCDTDA